MTVLPAAGKEGQQRLTTAKQEGCTLVRVACGGWVATEPLDTAAVLRPKWAQVLSNLASLTPSNLEAPLTKEQQGPT